MASKILALDVGGVRIGVAMADSELKFANPLITLRNDDDVWINIESLIEENEVQAIVVGLPRSLQGHETPQTQICRQFAEELSERFKMPVELQDEAATSVKAEAELRSRGKPYEKADIDALAATYILEDYLRGESI